MLDEGNVAPSKLGIGSLALLFVSPRPALDRFNNVTILTNQRFPESKPVATRISRETTLL
jgi:hypothetical protein